MLAAETGLQDMVNKFLGLKAGMESNWSIDWFDWFGWLINLFIMWTECLFLSNFGRSGESNNDLFICYNLLQEGIKTFTRSFWNNWILRLICYSHLQKQKNHLLERKCFFFLEAIQSFFTINQKKVIIFPQKKKNLKTI